MRVTSEAANDRRVFLGPPEQRGVGGFVREPGEKRDRSLLDRRVLRVLERHVEKPALEVVERRVAACVDDGDRRFERPAIAGECARRIAERVARELVEQHDIGERIADVVVRDVHRARERRLQRIDEARADRCVECRILPEPFGARRVRRRAEPEVENGSGEWIHRA